MRKSALTLITLASILPIAIGVAVVSLPPVGAQTADRVCPKVQDGEVSTSDLDGASTLDCDLVGVTARSPGRQAVSAFRSPGPA